MKKDYNDTEETFGKYLKELLTSRKISQRQLSLMSGISEGAISKYISGDRIPAPRIIRKLANALDVDFSRYLENYVKQMNEEYESLSSYTKIAKVISETILSNNERAKLIYLLIKHDLNPNQL